MGNTELFSPSVRVGCSVGDKTKDIIQKPYENFFMNKCTPALISYSVWKLDNLKKRSAQKSLLTHSR